MINDFHDIRNYEGIYEINRYGQVRTVERIQNRKSKTGTASSIIVKNRIRKYKINNTGYPSISLKKAGTIGNHGYKAVILDGKKYLVHRLIYKIIHNIEANYVDHINGIKTDNRALNLRNATRSENSQNRPHTQYNKLQLKGVYCHNGKFRAQICINKKVISLGTFFTALEAHNAYCYKASIIHGEFSNSGQSNKSDLQISAIRQTLMRL